MFVYFQRIKFSNNNLRMDYFDIMEVEDVWRDISILDMLVVCVGVNNGIMQMRVFKVSYEFRGSG